MRIRLLIKGDAIQYGENDFYCPCRTIDIMVADDLLDKEHEHIIGVEIEPQERSCEDCNHYGKLSLDCGRCDDDCSMYEPQESEVNNG